MDAGGPPTAARRVRVLSPSAGVTERLRELVVAGSQGDALAYREMISLVQRATGPRSVHIGKWGEGEWKSCAVEGGAVVAGEEGVGSVWRRRQRRGGGEAAGTGEIRRDRDEPGRDSSSLGS